MAIHHRSVHGRVAHGDVAKRQFGDGSGGDSSQSTGDGSSNSGNGGFAQSPSPSPSPSSNSGGRTPIALSPAATRAPQPQSNPSPSPAPSSDGSSQSFSPSPQPGPAPQFAPAPQPASFSPSPAPQPAPQGAPAPAPSSQGNTTPISNGIAAATGMPSATSTSNDGSNNKSMFLSPPSSATSSASIASSTSSGSSSSSNGMGVGGMVGIAVGIIAGIAVIGGLIFFFARRHKNGEHQEELNEKSLDNTAVTNQWANAQQQQQSQFNRTSDPNAPRLSLRPVTQFFPGAAPETSEKQSSWERQPRDNNPFEEAHHPRAESPPADPFMESQSNGSSPPGSREGSGMPAPPPAVAAGPAGAAGPSPPRGPNNVHRVQLDFKPSMEDELELRSGQLVRMLHEYDDGWALCVRMDRSQQGVCPRTCLSKLPVKPRQGPPPGARRGPPPPGGPGSRPQSPQVPGPNGMMPRPLTPNGGNGGRERSHSNAPRKPVPGMAM